MKATLFSLSTKTISGDMPEAYSTANLPASLDRLPYDILFNIAQHLPIANKAVLALTCKSIRWRLGHHLQFVPTRSTGFQVDSRKDFLLLLEKDLMDYIYCSECDILHTAPHKGCKESVDRPCRLKHSGTLVAWKFPCPKLVPQIRVTINRYPPA
jgi:hypothetical protein